MSLSERILLRLCHPPGAPDYDGTTSAYTIDNCLDFTTKTIPGFSDSIRGKHVLDYGCGHGWQAVALARQGAQSVVGFDIDPRLVEYGKGLARRFHVEEKVEFLTRLPEERLGTFDVVLGLGTMEHFRDPAAELQNMNAAVGPGGKLLISFGGVWLSPRGSHMAPFTKTPWVNVWFPEKTVMKVRSRFRDDGATRYEDIKGGLNKMTVAKFERIAHDSGMQIEVLKLHPTKAIPFLWRVPYVREFCVSAITCILIPAKVRVAR